MSNYLDNRIIITCKMLMCRFLFHYIGDSLTALRIYCSKKSVSKVSTIWLALQLGCVIYRESIQYKMRCFLALFFF